MLAFFLDIFVVLVQCSAIFILLTQLTYHVAHIEELLLNSDGDAMTIGSHYDLRFQKSSPGDKRPKLSYNTHMARELKETRQNV